MTHLPVPSGVRPTIPTVGNSANETVFHKNSWPGQVGFEVAVGKNTKHFEGEKGREVPTHSQPHVNTIRGNCVQQSKFNGLPLPPHGQCNQSVYNSCQSSRLPPANWSNNIYQQLPVGSSPTNRKQSDQHHLHPYSISFFPDINGEDLSSCLPVIKQQQVSHIQAGPSSNDKVPHQPQKPNTGYHGVSRRISNLRNHSGSLQPTFSTNISGEMVSSSNASDPPAGVAQKTRLVSNSTEEGPFMSPGQVLDDYSQYLTPYEISEIKGFEKVYFFGKGAKKVASFPLLDANNISHSGVVHNYGYDDDDGDYKVVTGDHCAYRYEILGELGKGSFGQVLKALDHKSNQLVALKIIKNKKKFHDQSLIEIGILETLRDNDTEKKFNVVRILGSFLFRSHMMVVFELHGMNLYELCRGVHFNPLPMFCIRKIAQQLLVTLYFCKELKIVHCDLKPENVLLCLNDNSGGVRKSRARSTPGSPKSMFVAGGQVDLSSPKIKVIDFGSSCYEHKRLYTYIQSRFYRAPEVMLGIPYTTAIDMWSLGCILAELSNGYPIFPGETENDQMLCIMEFLGTPGKDLVDRSHRWRHFFDASGTPLGIGVPISRKSGKLSRPKKPGSKDIGQFLRSAVKEKDLLFVDFITKCLEWDPVKRITPKEAIHHPWIQFGDATVLLPSLARGENGWGNARHGQATSLLPKIVNGRR